MRGLLRLALISLCVTPAAACVAVASAQDVLVVMDGDATERSRRAWERRVRAALDPVELEAWVGRLEAPGTVSPERLEVLAQIEALLGEARAATARLRERDALATLQRAEELAVFHLDVPGMSAWYAEVQLAIALTGAQAGQDGLSRAALRRAAAVDPSREVQAAEARPEIVERARAAYRTSAIGPRGRFEVRADVPGAVVWLDDRRIGGLPRAIEASAGAHVLRVSAPGHRSWARVITVQEGQRPPVDVRLAPTPRALAAARALSSARAGELGALTEALAAVDDELTVWVLGVGRARDRAFVVGCRASGCSVVRTIEPDEAPQGFVFSRALSLPSLARARAWLDEAPAPPPPVEQAWWERWYVWAAVGAVVAAGITAAVLGSQPQGEAPFVLEIDPRPLR